jgi:8-oxo-dGTP diphosphatase
MPRHKPIQTAPHAAPATAAVLVTAAVIERAGLLLLARRTAAAHGQGGWEFPGGKVEPGESPKQGLAREIKEELGVAIVVGKLVTEVRHAYPNKTIRLRAYHARIVAGEPHAAEHAELAWVPRAALLSYALLPADVPIARLLHSRTK